MTQMKALVPVASDMLTTLCSANSTCLAAVGQMVGASASGTVVDSSSSGGSGSSSSKGSSGGKASDVAAVAAGITAWAEQQVVLWKSGVQNSSDYTGSNDTFCPGAP